MRRMKNVGSLLIVICLITIFSVLAVSAEDGLSVGSTVNTVGSVREEAVPISYGLDVIAERSVMAIAGVKGNSLYFSAERFACAMNVSSIEYITVTRLPDIACGSLYIGSEGVSEGQKISASSISLMTYEEASAGVGSEASFEFTVNGSAYEITCNVYMIDSVNYSPTVRLASVASLNNETYRDVKVSGVLSAYDPEGDALVFEIVQYPENGRLYLVDEVLGTYSYVPDDSYIGDDSFLYVARDQYGNYSASARVNLRVSAQGTSTVYRDLVDDPMHSYAIAMTECGLMNGIQVGDHYYFEADREVTRSEFLITAMNAVGIKSVPDAAKTVFADDADIKNEMKGYVALAYSKGYISGIKIDGKLYYKPNEPIKLSEAAVIISNIIGYAEPKVVPVFADADKIPAWSGKAIESLHALGILETPDMISGAEDQITRGEMAKLLSKVMFVIGR